MYIACRQECVPRTLKEIKTKSSKSQKEIEYAYKLILKTLSISLDPINPADLMPRFCSSLSLPMPVPKVAEHISLKAVEHDLVQRRSPISIAAAAIYMASQEAVHKKTQEAVEYKGEKMPSSMNFSQICTLPLSVSPPVSKSKKNKKNIKKPSCQQVQNKKKHKKPSCQQVQNKKKT
ncbi:Transcription initiation factor IIB [Bulinus truncatus]|nr:Transcription initiation factor IIB [Bulinus truncatus]